MAKATVPAVTFEVIYERVCDQINANLQAMAGRGADLEPTALAGYSFLKLPRAALLNIAGDAEFIRACYLKLLDRPINRRDLLMATARLKKSKDRDQEIDKIMRSQEYRDKAVKVNLV